MHHSMRFTTHDCARNRFDSMSPIAVQSQRQSCFKNKTTIKMVYAGPISAILSHVIYRDQSIIGSAHTGLFSVNLGTIRICHTFSTISMSMSKHHYMIVVLPIYLQRNDSKDGSRWPDFSDYRMDPRVLDQNPRSNN